MTGGLPRASNVSRTAVLGLSLAALPFILVLAWVYFASIWFITAFASPLAAIAGLFVSVSALRGASGITRLLAVAGTLLSIVFLAAIVVLLVLGSTGDAVWS